MLARARDRHAKGSLVAACRSRALPVRAPREPKRPRGAHGTASAQAVAMTAQLLRLGRDRGESDPAALGHLQVIVGDLVGGAVGKRIVLRRAVEYASKSFY